MQDFVFKRGVDDFTHLVDDDGSFWSELGARSQPAFAFISDDGTIQTVNGALGEEELTRRVEELIAS